MAHWVICKHCAIKFNRDKEDAVKVDGRRYVHQKCYEEYQNIQNEEERDYAQLEEYIKQLFNIDVLSAKIKRQIWQFKKEYNYTYSGMFKTLNWWYGIKQNSLEKANNGIGIVPFVYQDALNYYHSVFLADFENSQKMANSNYNKPAVKTVEIESPEGEWRVKLFDLGV